MTRVMNTAALTLLACCVASAGSALGAGDPPASPTSLIAATAGSTGRVEIRWVDNSTNEAGFRIERTPAWSEGVIELPADTTGFYDQAGRGTFVYRVWAFNEFGVSAVAESTGLVVRRGSAGGHGILVGPTTTGVPTAPRRLRALPGSGSVHIDWQDRSSNESGFELERQTQDGTTWGAGRSNQLSANQVAFDDTVEPGVYRYRVRATSVFGSSVFTDWVIASVSGSGGSTPSGMPPAAPSGLTASDAGDGRALLSWSDNSGDESGFRIERDPAATSGSIAVGANVTSFIDACGNGTFRYRVAAVNSYGVSAFSGWSSVGVSSGTGGTGGGSTGGSTGGTSGGTSGETPGGTEPGGGSGTCPGGATGGTSLVGSTLFPGLPVGQDGWTVFTPATGSRVVYVSSSTGADTNTGLSELAPKRTLAAAAGLVRDGYPDWLVLKSGDVWTESLPWWGKSGRSQTEPMVIGAYETGARPELRTGVNSAFSTAAFVGVPRRFLVLNGLHFVAHTNDGTSGAAGVDITNGLTDVLIEDCMIERYAVGIAMQGIETRPHNIKVRRNVIVDQMSTSGRSTGMLVGNSDNVLVEECVFDHNGWSETVPGCTPTVFSHNVYINPDCTTACVVRESIVARAAANGLRTGGQLAEGNLLLANPIGIALGPDTRIVRNNVILGSRDIDSGSPRGFGMEGTIGANAQIYGNIIAHVGASTGNIYAISVAGAYDNLSLHHNIVYKWFNAASGVGGGIYPHGTPTANVRIFNNDVQQFGAAVYQHNAPLNAAVEAHAGNRYWSTRPSPFVEYPSWMTFAQWQAASGDTSTFGAATYPDAERSIATYMTSIGGSATLDAFLAEARRQSKANWRPEYTAAAVQTYIRAGFGAPALP